MHSFSHEVIDAARTKDAERLLELLQRRGAVPGRVLRSMERMIARWTTIHYELASKPSVFEEFVFAAIDEEANRATEQKFRELGDLTLDEESVALSDSALWRLMSDHAYWPFLSQCVVDRWSSKELVLDALNEAIVLWRNALELLRAPQRWTKVDREMLDRCLTCYIEGVLLDFCISVQLRNSKNDRVKRMLEGNGADLVQEAFEDMLMHTNVS